MTSLGQKSVVCKGPLRSAQSLKRIFEKVRSRLVRLSLSSLLVRRALDARIAVKRHGREVFQIYNYSELSAYRAKSFESKEPETLEWIDSMDSSSVLFDVGANVGIYSLYASTRNVKCIAFEPSALNYAQLNLNIKLNNLQKTITAFPLACHSDLFLSVFHLKSMEWASALSSFDRPVDQFGEVYEPVFSQGAVGMALDHFCDKINIYPTHLMIDVDGNEAFVVSGAVKILSHCVQSILIELSGCRNDHVELVSRIEGMGFRLMSDHFDDASPEELNQNFIFNRL